MKKLIVILLICLMAVPFASCENKNQNMSLANPWEGCKAEEVPSIIGHEFGTIEGALDTEYFKNESESIAEMRFVLDYVTCTVRVCKATENIDISGLYYTLSYSEVKEYDGYEWTVNVYKDDATKYMSYSRYDEEEGLILNFVVEYVGDNDIVPPFDLIFNWYN